MNTEYDRLTRRRGQLYAEIKLETDAMVFATDPNALKRAYDRRNRLEDELAAVLIYRAEMRRRAWERAGANTSTINIKQI